MVGFIERRSVAYYCSAAYRTTFAIGDKVMQTTKQSINGDAGYIEAIDLEHASRHLARPEKAVATAVKNVSGR